MQNWTLIGRRTLLSACVSLILPLSALAQGNPTVQFKTSMGDFTVELYPEKAPKTVDNFLQYVKSKHYEGTIFHRVIDGFMVQTGGYTFSMGEKSTRPPIPLEANNGLTNDRGTIAMARGARRRPGAFRRARPRSSRCLRRGRQARARSGSAS